MDSASSIEHRIAAMKQVYEAGIRTVCFVSPVFSGITNFEAIFERVKDQCDLFWLENLNLRGGFKKTIMITSPENILILYHVTTRSITSITAATLNPLRKRLTNIFNETSEPSSFCCLPIITIGVIDYRHCNQKNLKIYLSTLHKSV